MPRTTRHHRPHRNDRDNSVETKPAYLRPLQEAAEPAATTATVHILAPRASALVVAPSAQPTAA